MSWQQSPTPGVMGYWRCDSCLITQHGSCQMLGELRGVLSRQAMLASRESKVQAAALTEEQAKPVFEWFEHWCPGSARGRTHAA